MNPKLLTADCVVNRRADSAHDFFAYSTNWTGEGTLKNSVKPVAINDRNLVDSYFVVIELDFRGKAPH